MRLSPLFFALPLALFLSACGGGGGRSQADAELQPPDIPLSKLAGAWSVLGSDGTDTVSFDALGVVIESTDDVLLAPGVQLTEQEPGKFEGLDGEGRALVAYVRERYALVMQGPGDGVVLQRPVDEVDPVSDDKLRETRWSGIVIKFTGDEFTGTTDVSLVVADNMEFSLVYGDGRTFKRNTNTQVLRAINPDSSRTFTAAFADLGGAYLLGLVLSEDEGGLIGRVATDSGDGEYWILTPPEVSSL